MLIPSIVICLFNSTFCFITFLVHRLYNLYKSERLSCFFFFIYNEKLFTDNELFHYDQAHEVYLYFSLFTYYSNY